MNQNYCHFYSRTKLKISFSFLNKGIHDQPLNLAYLHLLSTVSLFFSGDRERHKPYRTRVFHYLVLVKKIYHHTYFECNINNIKKTREKEIISAFLLIHLKFLIFSINSLLLWGINWYQKFQILQNFPTSCLNIRSRNLLPLIQFRPVKLNKK